MERVTKEINQDEKKPAMNDYDANKNTYASTVNGAIISKSQTW